MRSWKCRVFAAAVLVCSVMASAAHAAIVITGTRVIYPAKAREVNVRLSNVDKTPVLVQAWIDDGHPGAAPSEIRVPFLLMPSVFRVEPNKGQSLRIMFTGADLPTDRESVYWLNVLEIPPKPANSDDRNLIQIAFRTRIKMFYRPASLTDDPTAYRSQLTWQFASNDKGERVLRVENPSPYYISLNSASLEAGGKAIELVPEMAPPFGRVDLKPVAGALDAKVPATVSFSVLSDFGAESKTSAQVGGSAQANGSSTKVGGAIQAGSAEKASDAVQVDDAEKIKQVQ
ncbi:fimbria/pilus periplasmic chaperone [Trinickia mobilis]|uniref:fimbria/pilus periplasmic chaperone n=1 Tax=Trinickia mobilis TaxID=2816356 RepID=UPI001A904124